MIKKITGKIKSFFGPSRKDPNILIHKEKIIPKSNQKISGKNISNEENTKRKNKVDTSEEYRYGRKKRESNKHSAVKITKEVPVDNWDESVFKVEVNEGKTRFHDLNLSKNILHAIFDLKFEYCSEVQAEVLPKAMSGNDITVQAQTGTGKTAAFLITIFNKIIDSPNLTKRKPGTPRALILAPTRELVLQIEKDAKALGKYVNFNILSLLGGMNYKKQQYALQRQEIDILVCTPGRLIDFMNKRLVNLRKIEILIIDEADRMLDMGFIPDVKKIVRNTPPKSNRQTMFFSATLTTDVKRLAESWTNNAFEIIIDPENITDNNIEEITYITTIDEKPILLYNIIMQKQLERVLIFANRKDEAKKLKEKFEGYGISCTLLSGDIDQSQRIKRLERFREGKVRVLVATNVASRGIHIDGISHVINYNMPENAEEYVHRIGRTGRAGASGTSISFADEDDSHEINKLEEYLGKKIICKFPEDELLLPLPSKHKNIKTRPTQNKKPHNKNYRHPRKRK